MKKAGIILGIVVLVIAGYFVSTRNGFVREDESLNTAWAQVETVLQRRYDLIPNIVNTVKGYATHEKDVFENVARLRTQWAEAKSPSEKVEAANGLEGALSKLMVVTENYPQLKADQGFLKLQDELAGTENRISVERQRYNEQAKSYNVAVRTFPGSVVAGICDFKTRPYFESSPAAKEAPKVTF